MKYHLISTIKEEPFGHLGQTNQTAMNISTLFLPILTGFLANFERPLTLVTHLCLANGPLVQFHQFVSETHPLLIRHLDNLNQLNERNEHHVLIVLNLACRNLAQQLKNETVQFHLNFNYIWLLVDYDNVHNTEESALDIFADIPIFLSSEIYFCTGQPNSQTIQVKRMYRLSLATHLIVEPIYEAPQSKPHQITWTRKNPSMVASRIEPPGLSGLTLKSTITALSNDTWNHLDDYHDPHIDSLPKINYQLTVEMIRYLNATVELHPANGFGYYDNATGEYTGMAGKLVRKEVDLAATSWFCNLLRTPYLQYVSMTCTLRAGFLFQSPKLTVTDNVFLLPFQTVGSRSS